MFTEKKTKRFTNGFVSVLDFNGSPVETTSTCLPIETEIRGNTNADSNAVKPTEKRDNYDFYSDKWMIGISTQSGCPVKCKFCAVNKVTEKHGWRNLTAEEMVAQVKYAVEKTGRNPEDSKIFRVLFTRMGEPSLNRVNVINAIDMIKTIYPNARIQISTIGRGIYTTFLLLEQLIKLEDKYPGEWLELQFSIHSTDENYRRWLQNGSIISHSTLNDMVEGIWFGNIRRNWKVTLNFSLSKDTPFNIEDLKVFNEDLFFIKLSPINENIVSNENGIKTLFNYKNNI